MSPIVSVTTLADLSPRNRLDAHCTRCRYSRRLDVQELIAKYGPLRIGELRERLRCNRCGARRPQVILGWDNLSAIRER
jgi:hypothetical protein